MGLFSGTKKVYVASTPYNLAGEFSERLGYLKTTVARTVLEKPKKITLGATITDSMLNGPGIRQRSFFRWSNLNYPEGVVQGKVSQKKRVPANSAAAVINVPPGQELVLDRAFIDSFDTNYWAEKHILDTRPEDYSSSWISEYDANGNQVVIQYADASLETVPISFQPETENLLVSYFYFMTPDREDPVVAGDLVTGLVTKPDTAGFTFVGNTPSSQDLTLTTTVVTTVDDSENQPPVTTTETSSGVVTRAGYEEIWSRVTATGVSTNGKSFVYEREELHIWKLYAKNSDTVTVVDTVTDNSVEPPHVVTTTVGTTTETAVLRFRSRLDTTQIYSFEAADDGSMLIYEMGSGVPSLDALMDPEEDAGEFFPFVPLRLHGQNVDHPDLVSDFEARAKAYERLAGEDIEVMLAAIEENENLDDIDHAFLVHGVEANTPEKSGKRYLYEFFRELIQYQNTSATDLENWLIYKTEYEAQVAEGLAWVAAQAEGPTNPLWGTAPPAPAEIAAPDMSVLRVNSEVRSEYDMRLSWITIDEEVTAGLGKPGAKKGDLWFETLDPILLNVQRANLGWQSLEREYEFPHAKLVWQDEAGSHRSLILTGMTHENYVYGDKAVVTSIVEALDTVAETGFIVPLHYPTLKKLPLATSTQLAMSNRLIVFNSFTVVTTRWYQSGWFKILITIVIAIGAAVFFPGGVGLLGSHLALGGTLGFSNLMAVAVGAAINAAAAMLLVMVIETGATELFGEKWGAIVATVVTFVAFQSIQNFNSTGSFGLDWGQMMRSENLLAMTNSVSGMGQKLIQGEILDIGKELETATEDYENKFEDIEKKTMELVGYSGVFLDPLMFTELQETSEPVAESGSMFLSRTLMTGTDIAEVSFAMIEDFSELSLALPDYTA